jgi:hypothetical protein
MSVGFGSDVDDENEEIHLSLSLSEVQLSEIRLAFTEVFESAESFNLRFLILVILQLSSSAYTQDGTWVRSCRFLCPFLDNLPFHVLFVSLHQQVPATTAALKKVLARVFERTGWEIKGVFTEEELADMIDAVVKEPPHMCAHSTLVLCFFVVVLNWLQSVIIAVPLGLSNNHLTNILTLFPNRHIDECVELMDTNFSAIEFNI